MSDQKIGDDSNMRNISRLFEQQIIAQREKDEADKKGRDEKQDDQIAKEIIITALSIIGNAKESTLNKKGGFTTGQKMAVDPTGTYEDMDINIGKIISNHSQSPQITEEQGNMMITIYPELANALNSEFRIGDKISKNDIANAYQKINQEKDSLDNESSAFATQSKVGDNIDISQGATLQGLAAAVSQQEKDLQKAKDDIMEGLVATDQNAPDSVAHFKQKPEDYKSGIKSLLASNRDAYAEALRAVADMVQTLTGTQQTMDIARAKETHIQSKDASKAVNQLVAASTTTPNTQPEKPTFSEIQQSQQNTSIGKAMLSLENPAIGQICDKILGTSTALNCYVQGGILAPANKFIEELPPSSPEKTVIDDDLKSAQNQLDTINNILGGILRNLAMLVINPGNYDAYTKKNEELAEKLGTQGAALIGVVGKIVKETGLKETQILTDTGKVSRELNDSIRKGGNIGGESDSQEGEESDDE